MGTSVNSFHDLGKLIKVSNKPTVMVKAKKMTEPIDIQDDTIDRVVIAMADGQSRSIAELAGRIGEIGLDYTALSKAVKTLEIDGYLVSNVIMGTTVYKMRPFAIYTPTIERAKPKLRKQSDKEITKPNPDGRIRIEDGLDLAIWKVMQDRKPRTPEAISLLLVEFGFDRLVIKNRVVTLMKQKTWFDRHEHGRTVSYVLKKTCRKPNVGEITQATTEDSSQEDQGGLVPDWEAVNNQAEQSPTETQSTPIKPDPPVEQNDVVGIDMNILKTDDFTSVLWKLMSDYEYYETKDIILLIRATGATVAELVTEASIRTRVSVLKNKHNWFDVLKVPGKKAKYRLKKNVNHPLTGEPYRQYLLNKAKSNLSVPQTTAQEPDVKPTQDDKPAALANVPASAPSVQTTESVGPQSNSAEPASLFETLILIKGEVFTIGEILLVKEFAVEKTKSLKQHQEKSNSLFETKYSIKGIDFTAQELEQLLIEFEKQGLK